MTRLALLGLLTLLGGCDGRPTGEATPSARTVAVGGVALTSASIALPADTEALPDGLNADLVAARCTACHSAGMILTQPALSKDQWQATVTKMREVYRAPVPAEEDAAIVAYLHGLKVKAP